MTFLKTLFLVCGLALLGTFAQFSMLPEPAQSQIVKGERNADNSFKLPTTTSLASLCIAHPEKHDQTIAPQAMMMLKQALQETDLDLFTLVFRDPQFWCKSKFVDRSMKIKPWIVHAKIGDKFEVQVSAKPEMMCRQFYSVSHDHTEPDGKVTRIWAITWTMVICGGNA